MTTTTLQTKIHQMSENTLLLQVTSVTVQTNSITSISFGDPQGRHLPSYVPGSHLVVQYAGGANSYSLTGAGNAPTEYSISVLRVENGAGGSLAMHALSVGDRVQVSLPRSSFAPVATATHHLLIAAGIGITPMLSHARYAAQWGASASLLYVHRPGTGAHVEDAREMLGSGLTECTDRSSFQKILTKMLTTQKLGTHLYICGPIAFMDSVLEQARDLGWPDSLLHSEAFSAAMLDDGQPFAVDLVRSGIKLNVPASVSLLETLESAGLSIPNMCRKGICGECAVPVLRGIPQHRDIYLTDQEKADNTTIMCCVSRSLGHVLELDL